MAQIHSDNTSPNVGKYIMQLDPYSFNSILYTQVSTSGYLLADTNTGSVIKNNDLTFVSNNNIWEKIILDNVRRTDAKFKLLSFFLFEWFPRSPGLFHTDKGYMARQEAKQRIISIKNGFTVYDPYGKLSMLEGGFGNVRLKPIRLENSAYYFMTASDNGICHEGFPVALPEDLYNEVIDEIIERGSTVKDLIGILRTVPEDIDNLYRGYKDVPKVYLQVEALQAPTYPKRRSTKEMSVTVASSFISNYEGQSKIYASYIGFDPSKKTELAENVEWMEDEYVRGMYKGRILTDFDQTVNHFDYAPFSLKKVMNLEVTAEDIQLLASEIGNNNSDILMIQNQMREHLKAAKKLNVATVFISYNNKDVDVAKRIQKRLEAEGFKVIRDEDAIETGERISDFINKSIRQSQFTLSVISRNSLVSAWVAMETITSGYSEVLLERKFLPVHIDDDFFNSRFVDDASDKIDAEIEEINNIITDRNKKDRGIEDLQDSLSRLRKLRRDLPEIVGKLRSLKCTDLSDAGFENGIKKLIDDIKKASA